jgi:hypothetical protein
MLVLVPRNPEALVCWRFFHSSTLSLLCSLSKFCWSVFKSILCHFHSTTESIQGFLISSSYFQFHNFILFIFFLTFTSLLRYSGEIPICFRRIICNWLLSHFKINALKSLSDQSSIWFMLVLALVECLFSLKMWLSWFMVLWGISSYTVNILVFVMLFKPSILPCWTMFRFSI